STTFQEPSTDIGYKKKKRLAKSGKDIPHPRFFLSTAVVRKEHCCGKISFLGKNKVVHRSFFPNS
ncbi:hypothetical protein POY96_18200, partial [Bacteroides uniformis]|uniref:hypothetical protein n=1 Tax=Bacteroides uniformis TaxID=820 RepID=UPI00232BB19D